MLKDSLYWDEFYKSEHKEITKPTLFANFIYETYIKNQNIANQCNDTNHQFKYQ